MSILRIGGIASGFDTDRIVKDMMRIERIKVDRKMQQRQVLQWQKEQFREVINQIRSFRDTYFDVLRPLTNMTSASTLRRMAATSTDPATVTATADADAMTGSSEIRVIQSATAARAQTAPVTRDSALGARLSLTDSLATVSAKLQNGPLVFDAVSSSFTVNINGTAISFQQTDSLSTALARINNSAAGIHVGYSTFSDTFTFTAKATGAQSITVDDGGSFFAALALKSGTGQETIGTAGRDAQFQINGFAGSNAANSFTVDGISYSIARRIEAVDNVAPVTVSVSLDAEAIFKNIQSFVEDYNKLITTIGGELNEERFSTFLPLTAEQKEQMSESEIEKWQERAQSGLLRRESALGNLLREMRTALNEEVGEGHLSEIGIEFSRNFRDNGLLVLRDGGQQLRAAIAASPEQVQELFTSRSSIAYSPDLSVAERNQRRQESGLANRLSDILLDNIRTTGGRGILVERAGLAGDRTEVTNAFSTRINRLDTRINRLNELMTRREEQLFRQFTAMETALGQLYAQGDWLAAQIGSLPTRR